MQWISRHRLQLYLGLLTLLFLPVLIRLVGLALEVDLHSHVLLIPAITGYLIWARERDSAHSGERREESGERGAEGGGGSSELGSEWRSEVRGQRSEGSESLGRGEGGDVLRLCASSCGGILFLIGLVLTLGGLAARSRLEPVDALALQTGGFLCLVVAGLGWFLGAEFLRRHAFALVFLVFMIPMPSPVEHGLEVFFQRASAEAADVMFQITGTTVLRTEQTFELPGLTIEVAEECSGIRSSYVLFIVSLLAGHLFLKRRWTRWFLTLFVIPLGIARNGFRILTISLLTIHWDPGVIHGPLHHRGGPVFFLLSLVPFFAVLWGLVLLEKRRARKWGMEDRR